MPTLRRPAESGGDPIADAQLKAVVAAYACQVPVLYVIISLSAALLAFSFWAVAPFALVAITPGLMISLFMLRLIVWSGRRERVMDPPAVRKALRSANIIGPILGASLLVWSLSLFSYGDDFQKAQVVIFCAFVVVSCTFSQLYARPAALGVTYSVIPGLTLFLVTRGEPTLTVIGVNIAIVCVGLVRMLFVHSQNFCEMIAFQLETKRLSDENQRLADLDSQTSLPNRRRFFARLEESICGKTESSRVVVAILDLDGFKPVNDLYGHLAGDQILVEVGRRLVDAAGADAFICRLGGDEFALILEGASDADALKIAGRVCDALDAPFALSGFCAKLSASMGLVAIGQCAGSARLLYERADYALYFAKQNSRGRPVMFSQEHETAIRQFHARDQALKSADLNVELSLHYQPIVDVFAGRVVTLEALARWNSPTMGSVSPADFIPIAERSELINRITQTLLRRALADAVSWPMDVQLSFNLSARDLSPKSILALLAIVENSGVDPRRLIFEITETAAMRDLALAVNSLSALRALGARIALDDFGSGHSSLSYVRQLPLDKIKIDRGFIIDIETDATSRDITKSMIDLCRNLKIGCVVEGVESESQRDILVGLGCQLMQGYLFSPPLAPGDLAEGIGPAFRAG